MSKVEAALCKARWRHPRAGRVRLFLETRGILQREYGSVTTWGLLQLVWALIRLLR